MTPVWVGDKRHTRAYIQVNPTQQRELWLRRCSDGLLNVFWAAYGVQPMLLTISADGIKAEQRDWRSIPLPLARYIHQKSQVV